MAGCCPEECVLVDDSRLNVEGAIREGMHGIHVSFYMLDYFYKVLVIILLLHVSPIFHLKVHTLIIMLQQKGEDSETAIRQLEQLLGLQLLSD